MQILVLGYVSKARKQVFTPEQHAVWDRMAQENGPPPEPPVLDSSTIASAAELEQFSPVFKAVRSHVELNLTADQKTSFSEFTEIVCTGIQWIKQYDYPKLYFPRDPGFDSTDPIGKTIERAIFHAEQYVLLKIVTAHQYDQLVPDVVGEREEFPRLKYRTAK